jgi:hypothetical protein
VVGGAAAGVAEPLSTATVICAGIPIIASGVASEAERLPQATDSARSNNVSDAQSNVRRIAVL